MEPMFFPVAVNPVIDGAVLHGSEGRFVDVNMTVEGIQSIETSGVATRHRDSADLPGDMLDPIPPKLTMTETVTRIPEIERYSAETFA